MSSRSMRAIWDAVYVALLGAPEALPGAERAAAEPAAWASHSSSAAWVDQQVREHLREGFAELFGEEPQESLESSEASQQSPQVRLDPEESQQPPQVQLHPQEPQQPPQVQLHSQESPQPPEVQLHSQEQLPAAAPLQPEPLLAAAAVEASEASPASPPGEALPEALPEALEAAEPPRPPVLFAEEGDGAFQDFFLFIKDYGWSLRYRVCQLTDSILDLEKPLKLEWVKLRRPLHNPSELLNTPGEELFDWEVREPPSHHGFMYHVTRAVGSGVEAVINFFEGHGLKLLIQPDSGIQLTGGPESGKQASQGPEDAPRAVTHCWVQVMGMPFIPMLQSIAFFNLDKVVMDWQA